MHLKKFFSLNRISGDDSIIHVKKREDYGNGWKYYSRVVNFIYCFIYDRNL